ncbi:hypothetical protein B0H12DRAFT_331968 [Mycena haematopus]|nr:hypothetical protein B0H12DRAFT_331968 [Mycena haematopus]
MDMSQAEQPTPKTQDHNVDEETAASKLWAIYISEAEKYDRVLVESWKSDMEGLLIFVGSSLSFRSFSRSLAEYSYFYRLRCFLPL